MDDLGVPRISGNLHLALPNPVLCASAKCAFHTLQGLLDVLQTEDHIPQQWAMKNMMFIIPRLSSQENLQINKSYAYIMLTLCLPSYIVVLFSNYAP